MTPEEIYRGFQHHQTFCRESLMVEREDRQVVPMILGPGQLRLREAIDKSRKSGRPTRIIYLKSRRIQATTGTAAEFFHATAFHAGVHTVVMAHDDVSVQNIFRIYRRFVETYRPFGGVVALPKYRMLSDRVFFQYGDDEESSFIQIHTAGSGKFGRSFRIDNVHFSEFPYYDDPQSVEDSVMSAVAKLPHTTAIIEGTAKTVGDHFHRIWQAACDSTSHSEWIPLFMGWWEHPTNRMPVEDPGRFQDSLSREESDLMGRFRLDLDQLAWRRWTIANDCHGDMARFRREHPATPEEAFTASSRNRFSVPDIQRQPIQREAVCGELGTTEVGTEQRLVFLPGETGALRIYRRPEPGRYYAAGCDPSGGADANEGKGQADPDYAVCHILDRDTGEQVAVFRARVMPGEFGRYCNRLLRWYNSAQVCIEKNGAGIGALEALLNAGYPPGLIYHRTVTPDQDPQVRSDKIGWNTDEVSRQQCLSLLDEALRAGAIFIHDPITQQELLTFVINPRGKAEAQSGTHDDTVMALAMAVIVLSRMPRPVRKTDAPRPEVVKYGQPRREERRGVTVRF